MQQHEDKDARRQNAPKQEWLRHIAVIIGINLLLALTSFFKDVFMAAYLGTSAQADAFMLSYFLVDTAGNNLWASALGVALLPVYSEIFYRRQNEKAAQLLGLVFSLTILAGILLIIVFYYGRFWIIGYIGSGLEHAMRFLAAELMVILLPALALFPLIAVGISVLQVHRRFGLSALSPVIFNTVLLAGTVYIFLTSSDREIGTVRLSQLTTLGVAIQFLFTWFSVNKSSWPAFRQLVKTLPNFHTQLQAIADNFRPYFLVLLSSQIIYGVERYLASGLGSGTLAALNYAFRLVQFPVWVVAAAVSAVAFPTLSRKLHLEGEANFTGSVGQFLYLGLLFNLPLTIILFVLRIPIVSVLFERGSFSRESTLLTASIMTGYTLTIVWQGFSALLIRVCLLKDNKHLPLLAALAAMMANIVLDLVLVKLYGAVALGFGAALGTFINFLILFLFLRTELDLQIRAKGRFFWPVLCANTAIFFIALVAQDYWNIMEAAPSPLKWGYLGAIGLVCAAIYLTVYVINKKVVKK